MRITWKNNGISWSTNLVDGLRAEIHETPKGLFDVELRWVNPSNKTHVKTVNRVPAIGNLARAKAAGENMLKSAV